MRKYWRRLMLIVIGGNAVKIDANARIKICPRCGNSYHGASALSRRDNETLVCPDCGTREALESIGVGADEESMGLSRMNRNRFLPLSTGAAGNNIYNLSLRYLCLL